MENKSCNKSNANMPKSLDECIAPYPTTENLYRWAERLKNFGYALCCLLIIIGLINITTTADAMRASSQELIFKALLPIIIGCARDVLIVYCAYSIVAVFLEALATTIQCKVIATKVALYNANQKADDLAQGTPDISDT